MEHLIATAAQHYDLILEPKDLVNLTHTIRRHTAGTTPKKNQWRCRDLAPAQHLYAVRYRGLWLPITYDPATNSLTAIHLKDSFDQHGQPHLGEAIPLLSESYASFQLGPNPTLGELNAHFAMIDNYIAEIGTHLTHLNEHIGRLKEKLERAREYRRYVTQLKLLEAAEQPTR